jgi:DNA polymerase-3 subunit delta'
MSFTEILGHERLRAILGQAAASGRVPPAMLFSGPDGVGKKTLALALARRLLCVHGPIQEACGLCTHCTRISRALLALPEQREQAAARTDEPTGLNHRLHPDLLLVEAWRTGIKIEQVRACVGEIAGLPFEARVRLVLVDAAHLMTEPAANSLLKSLEEPPPSSHVVLVTSAPQALLPTIRSRCQMLRFGRLPAPLLAAQLERTQGLDPDEARLRATLASGSLGDALAFEAESYRELRERLLAVLEGLQGAAAIERLEAAEYLAEQDDPALGLTVLRALLRDLAVLRAGAPQIVLNADLRPRLEPLAAMPLGARAARLAEAVGETRRALRGNAYKPLALDVLFDRLAGS